MVAGVCCTVLDTPLDQRDRAIGQLASHCAVRLGTILTMDEGDAFCGVVREDGLYPVVGVKGKVMVEGNFGTRPFAFSLDELTSVRC